MLAKAALLAIAFGWFANACPIPLLGDPRTNWQAPLGRNYQYVLLPPGATPGAGWYLSSFDHSSWLEGETIFSSVPFADSGWLQRLARTDWPSGTELFLYRTFETKNPEEAPREMLAEIAINGEYELYLNGALISAGSTADPAMHWNFSVQIGPAFFHAGTNEIGIRAAASGDAPFFDLAVWSIPEPATGWLLLLGFSVAPLLRRR